MKYAIAKLNEDDKILPNVALRAKIFDTSSRVTRANSSRWRSCENLASNSWEWSGRQLATCQRRLPASSRYLKSSRSATAPQACRWAKTISTATSWGQCRQIRFKPRRWWTFVSSLAGYTCSPWTRKGLMARVGSKRFTRKRKAAVYARMPYEWRLRGSCVEDSGEEQRHRSFRRTFVLYHRALVWHNERMQHKILERRRSSPGLLGMPGTRPKLTWAIQPCLP